MPYMVERIVHCHVVLPVLLVADSAYHNAVGCLIFIIASGLGVSLAKFEK